MKPVYQNMLAQFSKEKHAALIHTMNELSFLNKGPLPVNLAYIPVVLPKAVEKELHVTVGAYVDYISQKKMKDELRKKVASWLTPVPFQPFTHGAFDFHLCASGPKLIEYMAIPAGMVAVMFIAAKEYAKLFGFEFSDESVKQLKQEYTKSFSLGKKVAIVDVEPQKQITYPEFLCLQKMWEEQGHTVVIADPSEIDCENVTIHGKRIDTIYNRVTAPDLADSRLMHYHELIVTRPELFDPHPIQWYLGDKNSLVTLSAQKDLPDAVKKTLIPTKHIRDFTDWEHCKDYVFKPASSHANKGVLIYASKNKIKELMKQDYVFQKRYDADTLPYPDGKEMKYDVRICVFNGKPAFTYARVYQGMITKLKDEGSGFAPVFFA